MLRIPADSEQARRRRHGSTPQGASWGAEGKLFRREEDDVRYNFTSPKHLQKYNVKGREAP